VSEASLCHGGPNLGGESVFVFLDKDEDPDEAIVAAVEFDEPSPRQHADPTAGRTLPFSQNGS